MTKSITTSIVTILFIISSTVAENETIFLKKRVHVTYEITFAKDEKPNPPPLTVTLDEPTTFGIDLLVQVNKVARDVYKSQWTLGNYGAFVHTISGVSNDNAKGKYWFFYVNDKLADVGVSCFKLKNGDTMRFTYKKSSH